MNSAHQIPSPDTPAAESPVAGADTTRRVLLAEGNNMTRWRLLNALRMAGLNVDLASNGSIALNKFRQRPPDAILLELPLRGVSGVELIQHVRHDLQFADRPVYVFTHTNSMTRAARTVIKAQAAKVFDKLTVWPEELAALIATDIKPVAVNSSCSGEMSPGPPPPRMDGNGQASVADKVAELHSISQRLARCGEGSAHAKERLALCGELRRKAGSLMDAAAAARQGNLTRQVEVLEVFLDSFCGAPEQLCDRTVSETIADAVETIGILTREPVESDSVEFSAVVVDPLPSTRAALNEAFLDG